MPASNGPPASADVTSFVSRMGPIRRISQIDMAVHQSAQSQMMGQGDGQKQSGIGYQAVPVKGNVDAGELIRW